MERLENQTFPPPKSLDGTVTCQIVPILSVHRTGDQAASGPMGFSFVLASRHVQTGSEMETCAHSGRFIPRVSLSSFTMRI